MDKLSSNLRHLCHRFTPSHTLTHHTNVHTSMCDCGLLSLLSLVIKSFITNNDKGGGRERSLTAAVRKLE